MVFSSTAFLFLFLPVTLAGLFLLKEKFRNYWLLFVSILFFSWSQPQYLWVILLNIAVNYGFAYLFDVSHRKSIRKLELILCIIANLGLLIYFKYSGFILNNIAAVAGLDISFRKIILPIGISFFTFQGMSYSIDVYRKAVPVQKNPLKIALYITLFPQLIAGPIVRYQDIVKEIDHRKITLDGFTYGIQRFIIGLSKKVIIANTMAVIVDSIWNRGAGKNLTAAAWLGSIAYMLQIYYDFSGYSDMAIGLGRMFGFYFNENFDLPYISRSITEFWRRWHISLSTWFRDYVYIPIGGNRKRVYLNLAIVFLLTGIWHGASWNFILWGVWNGIFIIIERVLKSRNKNCKSNFFGLIYTLFIVNIGWVLFRAETLSDAVAYLTAMFTSKVTSGFQISFYLDRWTTPIMLLGILFATSLPKRFSVKISSVLSSNLCYHVKWILLFCIFIISIMNIISGTYNPFIYFQF